MKISIFSLDLNWKSGKSIERRICEAPSETCTETCGSQTNDGKCWIEYVGKEVRWVSSPPYNSEFFHGENARQNAKSYCEERVGRFYRKFLRAFFVAYLKILDPNESKMVVTQFLAMVMVLDGHSK